MRVQKKAAAVTATGTRKLSKSILSARPQTVKGESDFPFARAYDFLLKDKNLTAPKKLVMTIVCRYWPNPYWDTNEQIAKDLGYTERNVEKIIKSLADMKYIKRGYAHTIKNGRPHTIRVMVPKCFGQDTRQKIKWVKSEQMDGQQTEQVDGQGPNKRTQSPEHTDDLLERRKKEIEATPAPSPAVGQALASLVKKKRRDNPNPAEKFIQRLKTKWAPMPDEDFKRNKQQQLKTLQAMTA